MHKAIIVIFILLNSNLYLSHNIYLNMKKSIYQAVLLIIMIATGLSGCKKPETSNIGTNASLFWKKDSIQITEIISEKANQYQTVGHHGPAVENEFFALRMYFNNSGAIDVYSKKNIGLELEKGLWYPDSAMQVNGYGSDQYKVGSTIGLGGIRLWDGENVIEPIATKGRIARVFDEGPCSIMEMVALGVLYKKDSIDLLTRVSIFSGNRFARVDGFALCDQPVQFVTGINFHEGHDVFQADGFVGTWGKHPEDVALKPAELGAAIRYGEDVIVQKNKTDKQVLLISKPLKQIRSYITTASSKEQNINTLQAFKKLVESHNMH